MASIIKSNTYADFNGREILTANNDGALTTQKILYPAFRYYNNTTQLISQNTVTTVSFNTKVFDTDDAFDTSTNKFTVPSGKAGKYLFFYRLTYQTGTDFNFQHTLEINESFNADSGLRSNGQNNYFDTNFMGQIFDLSVGDTVRVTTYQNNSGHNISSGENRSNFQGFRIGS